VEDEEPKEEKNEEEKININVSEVNLPERISHKESFL
jgi:hypothetical protein